MATKAQIAKMQADLKKAEANLKKARTAAAKKPAPPTSGAIPGFKPSVTMPTPAARSDEPGFVGPVAPVATPTTTTTATNLQELLTAEEFAQIDAFRNAAEDAEAAADARVAAAAKGGEGGGGAIFTATDGTVFNDEATYNRYQELLNDKTSIADTRKRDGESAYNILYKKFSELGLGSLVQEVERYIKDGLSEEEFTLRLRETPSYQLRFAANKQRIAKGLSALSEANYIKMEDQYQEVMRQYGLPASYYEKDDMGTQKGFTELLANDVSNTELEDRLIVAQDRVLKANPEVLKALKDFYPDIKNGDILAYTLDPKNAIKNIQSKVTAAEIGGAALAQGLNQSQTPEEIQRYAARAEQLAGAGVTKAAATAGFATIGAGLQRGSELASIYQQDPYTQTTAESEIFNVPGAKEARKQRQKITGLEKAAFGGQSGITQGALARDRAGGY
jgi:hypothetical protein